MMNARRWSSRSLLRLAPLCTLLVTTAGPACRSGGPAGHGPDPMRDTVTGESRPAEGRAVSQGDLRATAAEGAPVPASSDRQMGGATASSLNAPSPNHETQSSYLNPVDDSPARGSLPAHGFGDLQLLAGWLEGAFDTRQQSQADPTGVRHLLLHVVRIWPQRADGPWFYFEEAAAAAPDRPHRQRVLRLSVAGGDVFELSVFALPADPQRFAGSWLDARRLDAIGPEQLDGRAGCTMYLKRRDDGAFVGATLGMDCPGEEFGSAYMQCDLVIRATRLEVWERVYDGEGRQIAGPTSSPLVFERDTRPAVSVSGPD